MGSLLLRTTEEQQCVYVCASHLASHLAGPSTKGLHRSVHAVLFLNFDAVVLCCRVGQPRVTEDKKAL